MQRKEDLGRILVDLWKKDKRDELNKRISQLTENQIETLLEKVPSSRFSELTDLIKALFSCFEKDENTNKQKKLLVTSLNILKQGRMDVASVSSIVTLILTQIDVLNSETILELISYYFQTFSTEGQCGQRWIEILPKLFQNLVQFDAVKWKDEEVFDGKHVKSCLIKEFCDQDWRPNTLVHVLTAFKDINANPTDLQIVVNKTIDALKDVPLIDIPPIIYQLLLLINLCEKTEALRKVCEFFASLDEKNEQNKSLTANQTEIVKEVEGTVILHLMFAVKQNQEVGRVLINNFKNNISFLVKPFNAALLLSISQISRFNEQALDIFKSTLISCLKDKEKRNSSAWVRSKFVNFIDVEVILKRMIKDCLCGWDYVLEGLRELGVALLETHLPKVTTVGGKILSDSNVIAHTACRWGELIILECFKQHHRIRTTLIREVLDAVFLQTTSALYYIELLAQFVGISPQSVLECKEKIFEHFEHLPLLSHDVSVPFVKVFMPLVKLKPDLRDKLVEVLKKSMFCKELEARKTAVGGFLLFLRHFQIMNAFLSNSQSQSQTFPTFSSQMLTGGGNQGSKVHYERLCLEIVCCLRKALSQQGEVRKMLYAGLYNAARRNKQLLQPILDLLLRQLDDYLESDEEKLPPICLEKCVVATKNGALVMEPLGCLIQALCSCFVLTEDDSASVDEIIARKSKTILSNVVKKLARSELEDFSLDKSADYSADTAVGQKNSLLAFELLSMYEASLEFCWKNNNYSLESVELIGHLQNSHSNLSDVLREKCVVNPNKKSAIGKANGVGGGRPTTVNKKADFTTIQLSSLVDFFTLLLCDSQPARREAMKDLRAKIDFVKWMFSLGHAKIRNCLNNPELDTSKCFDNLCRFAKLMFQFYTQNDKIVDEMKRLRLSFLADNSLETFSSILEIICIHYADKIETFLDCLDINSNSSNEDFAEKLYKHIRDFTRILIRRLSAGNVDDEESDDKKQPKQILCLIRIVENLIKFLPCTTDQYEQVYNSFLLISEGQAIEEPSVAKPFWNLLFQLQIQTDALPKKLIYVAQNIYQRFGDNNEEDVPEPDSSYISIGAKSVTCVSHALVAYLDSLVDNNLFVISKLKQNLYALQIERRDEQNREKLESDCCDLFGLIIAVWQDLLKANIPLTLTDVIVRSLQKFYVALTGFIRYNSLVYQKKVGHHCSTLEKLAIKSVTHLTPLVYSFLSYFRGLEETVPNKKKRTHNTVSAKTKVIREMKTVSSLIFAIENYEKTLIQFGSKAKVNLMEGAKPSKNCDFRIDLLKVKRALEDTNEENDSQSTTVVGAEETQKPVAATKRKAITKSQEENKPLKRKKL